MSKKDNFSSAAMSKGILGHLHSQALFELLVEKGVVTKEELRLKLEEIVNDKNNFEGMNDFYDLLQNEKDKDL